MTPLADGVLTLDVGTSSTKALLFDSAGHAVEGVEGRVAYSVRTTPDGGAELDAPELVDHVLSAVRAAAKGPARAVAVCTFWHSLMGVDPQGAPLTPVYTWADTRSHREADELKSRLDEKAFHGRTGARFHPLYFPAKLLWASRRLAERDRSRVRWMSFGEFLFLKLFGKPVSTVSMASGTGLLDVHTCDYDEEILKAIGVRRDQLSPLGQGTFTGQSAVTELRDTPWHPPVGDGACNNLGSGCATRERIGVMVGTSGAMRAAWAADRAEIPWGLWCYRADRRRFVMGGALSEGGNLIDWIRGAFRLPDDTESEVAALPADGHGLTFLPFIAGERSPGWVADARATLSGLSLDTQPAHILRAGMEAVAYRFALIHRILSAAVPEARQIVASGGGLLNSPAWMQILADALGVPITASAEPEASARGAALLALEAQGIGPVEAFPAAMGRTYEPDAGRHAIYAKALERQKAYYDLLVKR